MVLGAERQLNNIKYWLVTIRKHDVKHYVSSDELEDCITYLRKSEYIKIRDYCFEAHGKYKQYHAHVLIETPEWFKYRGLTKYHGFRIHWRAVYKTPDRVCGYIHKHCNNHCPFRILQNELANFFKYHYLF